MEDLHTINIIFLVKILMYLGWAIGLVMPYYYPIINRIYKTVLFANVTSCVKYNSHWYVDLSKVKSATYLIILQQPMLLMFLSTESLW